MQASKLQSPKSNFVANSTGDLAGNIAGETVGDMVKEEVGNVIAEQVAGKVAEEVLVEGLKEKRESSPVSVEVITATKFEKFRKSTRKQY
ncbi:5240_t:CDS:2 [Funneliformis caledonium]|uniref:5240_t:CDS:1 n=1 Tax=Funneliformis caledonium TaxID=1117310 RepID=A0A9N9BHD2_9GLOM|nr:5240_t:CDS:2 [Funneliformis caledonium]